MRLLIVILTIVFAWSPAYAKGTDSVFQPLKLERVVDGDTIVASGQKIRLWGFDTPEKGHPLYKVATLYLETILAEGGLTCKFIDTDKYQRAVMHCRVNGADIGAMMVRMGMARDFTKYSKGFYQREQREAQANKRGLWADQ